MKRKSNIQVIYELLLKGKSVNTIDAINGKYGKRPILRLSDIIFQIRKAGYVIKTEQIRNKTNSSSTALYTIDKE